MQTKLTLRMEDKLIARAKAWAERRGVSLSQVVASVLEQIPSRADGPDLVPWTEGLLGLAAPRKGRPANDAAVRAAHLDHVARHHR
jgi:hypothetical protein